MRGPLASGLFALLLAACQSAGSNPVAAERSGALSLPSATNTRRCQIALHLDEPSGTLSVELQLPPSAEAHPLRSLERSRPFFRKVIQKIGVETSAVPFTDHAWHLAVSHEASIVEYQLSLPDAVRRLGRWRATERIGRSYVISLSALLLQPDPRVCGHSTLKLTGPADFALIHTSGRRLEIEFQTSELAHQPSLVIGPSQDLGVAASNGALRVVTQLDQHFAPAVFRWIEREAGSLRAYFTRFPVPSALLILRPGAGGGAYRGSAHGHGAALIKISVDREATDFDLANDWELLHEFIHLCLPNLDRRHRWMEEGLSTYLGIVIRLRTGRIDARRFWAELSAGLANALSTDKRVGFNTNATWGETYWGGALYFFRVDLAIHEATKGRFGLRDVLLEVQRRGGDIRGSWAVEALFRAEEERTGTSFLRRFHTEMGEQRTSFDPDRELEALGVKGRGRALELSDEAPRAALRSSFERWTLSP